MSTKVWNKKKLVIDDLKYSNMENLSMEMIRSMKRTSCMNKIKDKINLKAFENPQKVKEFQSKVKEIQNNLIKIQKYLQKSEKNKLHNQN